MQRLLPLALALLCSTSVGAATVRRQCRDACDQRIGACEAAVADFGALAAGCAKAVRKACAREGLAVCQVTTTTTTTTTTSTMVVGINGSALLQTGQTDCWSAAGPLVPCDGTGMDGDVRAGLVQRYVDNGDGTITDANTGLVWEKLSDDGSVHDKDQYEAMADAAAKVSVLNAMRFAGHADWRIPNVVELQSLATFGWRDPAVFPAFDTACVPGCSVLACSCTRPTQHWSSTSDVTNPGDAWAVNFHSGAWATHRKSNGRGVLRAVRGGP